MRVPDQDDLPVNARAPVDNLKLWAFDSMDFSLPSSKKLCARRDERADARKQ